MIALRKLFRVFGRGALEFLNPDNRKILAYTRRYDPYASSAEETAATPPEVSSASETVLCVANLSRFSQPVSLDLARFAGMIPVEMLGYVPFPAITTQAYPLTLAPYSFLWLELQPAPETPQPVQVPLGSNSKDEPILNLLSHGIEGLLSASGSPLLQQLLT